MTRNLEEHSLDELASLADTAGAEVVGKIVQQKHAPDPATLIGTGKVHQVSRRVHEVGADVVIFDPDTVADKATFEQPHQYSVGVRDVIVNGVPVLRDGEHTGATPGRFVKGPGYTGTRNQGL